VSAPEEKQEDTSEEGKAEIERIEAQERVDPRKAVSIPVAAQMQGISKKTVIRLVERGELVSFLDGGRRLMSVASIYDRLKRLVRKANPAKGPKPKRNPFWGIRPHEAKAKPLLPEPTE
jgi:hypothetical protein